VYLVVSVVSTCWKYDKMTLSNLEYYTDLISQLSVLLSKYEAAIVSSVYGIFQFEVIIHEIVKREFTLDGECISQEETSGT